jgi:hypothetical protein
MPHHAVKQVTLLISLSRQNIRRRLKCYKCIKLDAACVVLQNLLPLILILKKGNLITVIIGSFYNAQPVNKPYIKKQLTGKTACE